MLMHITPADAPVLFTVLCILVVMAVMIGVAWWTSNKG
jgi:hypothetical protein